MTSTSPNVTATAEWAKRNQPDWINEIVLSDLEQDPNPIFDRLRREAPLAYIPGIGTWVASTRPICAQIATDTANFGGGMAPTIERTFDGKPILGMDGDDHRDLRNMVDPQLAPQAVDSYVDDLVRPIARKYVAEFEDRGHADLVEEYFEPVSVRTLGDLLGFNEVDSDTLRRWFKFLSCGIANGALDKNGDFLHPEGFDDADEAKREIRAIVDPMMARLKDEPDDTGISHWMHDGMPEGQIHPPDRIYPTLFTVILGGMQEPGHACSAAVYGLLQHPDQFDEVLEKPHLIPRAINEGLRWIAPIWNTASRIAHRDTEIGDVVVRAGDVVMLSYGSANRDIGTWETAPNDFDLHRPVVPHLAFGAGAHVCAGAYQAQHTSRIALEELFDSIPNLELDDSAGAVDIWGWDISGLTKLNVRWEV
ncbi:cytochrome P450 [Mycolicibacterium chlorophenolicum]|uniref:Cytochrome P450-pinF2, plant-inducible n=1 Tax=Mycolicibacterium chlorophenolicum TaxID=37916 RepID=A0A0J6WMI9_9MYCO|nr:cytochrome P450 [Mycolicibacterium chlorophenolicum]KMO83804.1 Cytochrome P450-pinF2, plant-inducible [Mycolicibacterium chlorophenolicum]